MNDMRYFRQALALMREEKLYSAMYIAGTALAVAFVMLIPEVYYVKVADIAPEVHRSTTYYLYGYTMKKDPLSIGDIRHEDFRDLFQKMQTPTCVTAIMENIWRPYESFSMKLADGIHDRTVRMKMTEPGFFRLYQFRFTEGAPFTQDDFDSGRRMVVVTEEIAKQTHGAVGSTISIDNHDYRICGVVETPSVLAERCAADVWCPYAAEGWLDEWSVKFHEVPVMLYFSVPADRRNDFLQELKAVEARYNALHKDAPVGVSARLYSHYDWIAKELTDMFEAWGKGLFWYIVPSILMLLLVPALNLSGMVAARMERHLPEMAVRKAFGAKRRTLLGQIIMENLVLTLIGGIVGLCIAWMALYVWRDWVFIIFAYGNTTYNAVPILKGEMFFGPAVFAIALLVCCVLNILAATLPAWLSLRKPIVESMMIKK